MKMKARTKKILVLSVMVVLLVTTGVLNFVLSDKLTNATENVGTGDGGAVVQTFFAAARSDREARRESQFLYLDAIIKSDSSSDSAKATAEEEKMQLVKRMEQELELETAIKAKGFDDVIVTLGDGGATVVVGKAELTEADANIILDLVVAKTGIVEDDVNIIQY